MKLVCRSPLNGDTGMIYIYNLSGLEYRCMLEEVRMTKRWVDRLYEEEHPLKKRVRKTEEKE